RPEPPAGRASARRTGTARTAGTPFALSSGAAERRRGAGEREPPRAGIEDWRRPARGTTCPGRKV
ncbi:hypothetical protein, partial [Frankia sp. CiP1_Cm_nod1]|uniref:hypothetical protein n=1 Tax=Frankia sp. CiP1_Cm_nod1 TaxID=2897160 RepID=UPI0020247B19